MSDGTGPRGGEGLGGGEADTLLGGVRLFSEETKCTALVQKGYLKLISRHLLTRTIISPLCGHASSAEQLSLSLSLSLSPQYHLHRYLLQSPVIS